MTKGKTGQDHAAAEEELILELRHLRIAIREAAENFALRREGEIESLIGHLQGLPAAARKNLVAAWQQEIRHVKLKPEKGRMKDLKGVDSLLERLADGVISPESGT